MINNIRKRGWFTLNEEDSIINKSNTIEETSREQKIIKISEAQAEVVAVSIYKDIKKYIMDNMQEYNEWLTMNMPI